MTDERLSRRSALRLGAGGIAAATTTGLAGCSSIPFLGGGGGGGSSTVQKWAYDPGEIDDQDAYSPNYYSLSAVRDAEDELSDQLTEALETSFEQQWGSPLDVDFEDADWTLTLGRFRVTKVDHTVADVVERLEDEKDYDEDDEVDGYTIVVDSDDRYGYAIDGSTAIRSDAGEEATEFLEEMIATQSGDVDMYVDEDEDFADAITNVDGDIVSATVGRFEENVVAAGSAATFNGEQTTASGARVYNEKDDVDRERIRELASEQDDLSVSFSGRVVTFERTVDTDEYSG